jgi:hypothetical protein
MCRFEPPAMRRRATGGFGESHHTCDQRLCARAMGSFSGWQNKWSAIEPRCMMMVVVVISDR